MRRTAVVAHAYPLVAAGIASTLRRQAAELDVIELQDMQAQLNWFITGSEVQIVIGDLDQGIPSIRRAIPSESRLPGRSPKLLAVTTDGQPMAGDGDDPHVDGCVSVQCPPDELIRTVRALIKTESKTGDSPQLRLNGTQCSVTTMPRRVARSRPLGGLSPGALRRVHSHIEANLHESINLTDLAAVARLSVHHFSRAFRQSCGIAPHRYILARRIRRASQLISETDKPLAEVALEVGFSDQSHFTRVFSRATGETPAAFRRMRRQ